MKSLRRVQAMLLVVVFVVTLIIPLHRTLATGNISTISDTLSRVKISTAANHTIVFTTPTGIDSGDTVTLTFATGFSIASVVVGDVTIGGNAPASAVPVGQVLTITTDADTTVAPAGTATIVIGNNHITNPGSAASYKVDIAGTFDDIGSFAIAIVNDDRVVVNTTIDPYVTFAVTTTTVTLTGDTSSGNPSYTETGINEGAANTLAAATNGNNGYGISYNGATLTNGGNTITAIGGTPAAAGTPGTEQFGLNLMDNTDPNTGAAKTGDVDGVPEGDYDTVDEFAFEAGSTVPLANSSTNPAATTTFTVAYAVNVSEETEPGAYQTTITYICTGNF